MPDGLAAKLEAARASRQMLGERRVITMLFCDVTGSTSMAGQLDPEEWAEIMSEAFDYLIAPVYRYEGTLARLMGDGLLAFFGAPIAHEDDPQRAVMAGLDIVHELQPFCAEIEADYDLRFNVRVGINTGPVVVGDIGSDLAVEYTAMGDAINLAARMEQTAVPGTVQISADTFHLVAPLFDCEALGAIQVKGKEEPVEAYRVLGQKKKPGRLRGISGLDTPLVGRDQEFDFLKSILSEVRGGQGRAVFLIGEAGLGKSRLIDELHREWFDRTTPVQSWYQSQGVAYESSRPYSLFHERLRVTLGLDAGDTPDTIRQKAEQAMAGYDVDDRAALQQAVLTLLAVETPQDEPRLEAEALKRLLQSALTMAWRQDTQKHPVVAVFDDLHWADPASAELLIKILPLVLETPSLLICAMRPYRESPGWQVRLQAEEQLDGYYHEFDLSPLSTEATGELVSKLLTISDLPLELRRLILRKAEGNPFFVEEVVRSLIDAGIVVRDPSGLRWLTVVNVADIDVPDNLQTLLISRIDRLDREARSTLQLASVIGRSFYQRVLQHISADAQDLDGQLETLLQADLIMEGASLPEPEYLFRHELTRDATYQTLLHRQRRRIHRQVGEALETLFPESLAEEAHRLAYHFAAAGNKEKALTYAGLAGDTAARLYANAEAGEFYRQAINLAKEIGSNEQLISLNTKYGRTLEVGGHYDQALDAYHELAELGQERQDKELQLAADIAEATIHSTYTSRFDPIRARALSKEALSLAQELGDHQAEAKIYWNLMLAGTYAEADLQETIDYGNRSLAIARRYDLQEQLSYSLHDIVRPYAKAGEMNLALDALNEARELFRRLNNLPMLADNLITSGLGYQYFVYQLDTAVSMILEGISISRSIGSLWGQAYGLAAISPLYLERGEIEAAFQAAEQSLPLAQQANFIGPQIYARTGLISALSLIGDFESARLLAADAETELAALDHIFGRLYYKLAMAEMYLAMGDPIQAASFVPDISEIPDVLNIEPEAVAKLAPIQVELELDTGRYQEALSKSERLVGEIKKIGVVIVLPKLYGLQARALYNLGRNEEAVLFFEKGRQLARDLGTRVQLWEILSAYRDFELARGRSSEAAEIDQETREVVNFIADHIERPDQKEIFMNRPDIRDLIV